MHCGDAELSALGVAHMAGLGVGVWDMNALRDLPRAQQTTQKLASDDKTGTARRTWAHAVARARLATGNPTQGDK